MIQNPPPSVFHKAGMATFPVHILKRNGREIKIPIEGWRKLPASTLPTRSKSYGIALSEEHLVIDVDIKNGKKGQESWDKMQALLKRPLAKTIFTVQSPSGGWHVWFKLPAEFNAVKKNKNYPDIDFLSEGEYVVGPGTQFKNSVYSKPYQVIQGEFDPEWDLHDLCVPPLPEEWYSIVGQSGGRPFRSSKVADFDFRDEPCLIPHFIEELQTCDPAIEGQNGNDTTYAIACKGRSYGFFEDTTFRLMLKYYNPRCKPPWDEYELEVIVSNAYQYGQGAIGEENYANYLDNTEDEEIPWEQVDSTAMDSEVVRTKTKLKTYTASDIMQQEFPPIRFIVPDLMPEGLTLFAGAPKIGKSWMALNLAYAVATGGCVLHEKNIEPGRVLYLALEDTSRRIQNRLKAMGVNDAPPNLHFAYEIPRADQGGLTMLEEWLDTFPDCRVVIIDTLQRFRQLSFKESYANDYEAMIPIHKLAKERGVSIILVHHTRKAESSDIFDQISGTQGIFGSVDTAWVLKKKKRTEQDATLDITSRDIQEQEIIIRLDSDSHRWRLIGEAWKIAASQEEQDVLSLFSVLEDGTLSAKDLQDGLSITEVNARKRLSRMTDKGLIERIKPGKYKLKAASLG